jgi:hypothetical protein
MTDSKRSIVAQIKEIDGTAEMTFQLRDTLVLTLNS